VWIDCDVLQADGGTRCAAICGGYVALVLALTGLVDSRKLRELPLTDSVAAVSVGIVDGVPMLDLPYEEDSRAEVDMNVVISGRGPLPLARLYAVQADPGLGGLEVAGGKPGLLELAIAELGRRVVDLGQLLDGERSGHGGSFRVRLDIPRVQLSYSSCRRHHSY